MSIMKSTTKRERQILEFVYAHQTATATQLEEALPGNPSNSAVRWHLRSLESKGMLTHTEVDGVFVYRPTEPRESAAMSELARVVTSFFGGSVTSVMTTLLDQEKERLTADDIAEMRKLIDRAEEEGR